MKIIIIIEDDLNWVKKIKTICGGLGLETFPSGENEEFLFLLSNIIRSLYLGTLPEYKEKSEENLKNLLKNLMDKKDVLFILDYDLGDNKPGVTGINFYEKFLNNLPKKVPAIFMSGTTEKRILQKINDFCKTDPSNFSFIEKYGDWNTLLKQKLQEFLDKK